MKAPALLAFSLSDRSAELKEGWFAQTAVCELGGKDS